MSTQHFVSHYLLVALSAYFVDLQAASNSAQVLASANVVTWSMPPAWSFAALVAVLVHGTLGHAALILDWDTQKLWHSALERSIAVENSVRASAALEAEGQLAVLIFFGACIWRTFGITTAAPRVATVPTLAQRSATRLCGVTAVLVTLCATVCVVIQRTSGVPVAWHRQTAAWVDTLGIRAARYQNLYGLSPSTWIFSAIVTSTLCVLPVVTGATYVRRHGADVGGNSNSQEDASVGTGQGQR